MNAMSISSIVTPVAPVAPVKGKGKVKAQANGTTALTATQACEIAFEYGKNVAGQDGTLTLAFKTFAKNDKVIGDMVQCLQEGYFVRKLDYSRDEAKRVIGLAKFNSDNPEKNTDKNRTAMQESIMVSVRMLVSRAKKAAGIGKPAATAEEVAKRAKRESDKKEHDARLIKADEIVNPKDDVDVFDALNRLVLTMKSLPKKYAAKLVDDRGSEWRDWLANAPR